MKLSAKSVEAARKRPGRYGDGLGLYLEVKSASSAYWVLRYERGGKEHWMGLGPLHTFSLAEARQRARAVRQQLFDGVDPLEAKRATQAAKAAAAARALSFKDASLAYYESHEAKWTNRRYKAQFLSSLESYAWPTIGALSVSDIDTGLVLQVLEPIWREKCETADRVRGRIEAVLDWAAARGHRSGENPARWRGHIAKLLPSRQAVQAVQHHPALPYAEVSDFLAQLRMREGTAARAAEFVVLTATRTGEALGATWDEIDLERRVWTIPAQRMKGKKEHRVPLCDRAVALLKALPREARNKHVFIGTRAGAPLSSAAMVKVLHRMKRSDLTIHGFRSTFRDWAGECTNFPNHVVEMALAHSVGNAVERAYRRGDLFEKRRALMAAWGQYCDAPPAGAVIPMRAVG